MSWHYDAGYFHFMLNLIITQLEYVVDRVMVPLNRVFPSATTFAGMGQPLFVSLSCLWSVLMTHKCMGSIVVLLISKSVEPNEDQKEMISGF